MCSVVGCDSWRRNAQRYKLPEDPESRLEWVQFLFEANGQRLKESSWTDITICFEHFTHDCFDNLISLSGTVQLKSSAVPSLCIKSEPEEQELPEHPESYQVSAVCKEESDGSASEGVADGYGCASREWEEKPVNNLPSHSLDYAAKEEPVETTDAASQYDQLNSHDSPSSDPEESEPASPAAQESPVPSHASDDFMSDYRQVLQKVANLDIIREKAALLQIKGKYVVNQNCLLQLFGRKCPSCGSEVKVEKFTYGLLIVLNQQCLQCEYRHQWKSQASASVPTADDQHLTGGTDVTPLIRQIESTAEKRRATTGVSEMVAVIDEESDPMDEVSGDEDDTDLDEDWDPKNSPDIKLPNDESNEESTDDDDDDDDDDSDDDDLVAGKHTELCPDCGKFFYKRKRHTCEHKIKPYSCNICGKRCVTEAALSSHSRVHDEKYEHRCKYCHGPFKTKVDKITHEQTHLSEGKPYKCPECSETFATNKERRVHLEVHGETLKCHICGLQFYRKRALARHVLVHTGERAFKCPVCQRDFNQQSHLKSHMRLHTGERPYECQHCDKRFNHNVSLKSHVQRYHASNSDNVEETGQKGTDRQKRKRRSTGRPKGRPKRNAADNLVSEETQGQCSNTKTAKVKARKIKKMRCSDEES